MPATASRESDATVVPVDWAAALGGCATRRERLLGDAWHSSRASAAGGGRAAAGQAVARVEVIG